MFFNLERNATYYAKHINLLIGLGSFTAPTTTTLFNYYFFLVPFTYIEPLVKPFGLWETLPEDGPFVMPLAFGCRYSTWLCDLGVHIVSDSNTDSHDPERKKVYFGHYPSGSSIRNW